MNWWGKKKSTSVKTTSKSSKSSGSGNAQDAIIRLRTAVETQEKRENHLQKKIDNMVIEAKEKMAKGDKKGAMFALKRKKMYEGEMEKICNVKMTLETQVMNLESAAQNADTFNAMKSGTKTMKKIRTDLGIDKVDDLMDDIREEMDTAKDISDAMAQPIDGMYDEDELLSELADLENMGMEQQMLDTGGSVQLPDVPGNKLPALSKTSKEEEDELRKLEAELAGM